MTYNGHEMHEFVPERTAAYIGQYDVHMPKLTVRETLKFSAKCQGVGTGYGMNHYPLYCTSVSPFLLSNQEHLSKLFIDMDGWLRTDMLEELLRREKKFNIKPDPYLDALMKVP